MPGVDRDTFRRIFEDHWDKFKGRHPWYAAEYYEEVVQKMLGCGREVVMPVLGCPDCNRETMEYTGIKSPPEGR